MKDVIQKFIQEIVSKAGLDNMPDDFKKEYSDKLAAEAERRLGIMALAELDENSIKDFEKFMADKKSPKQSELMEFFDSHITGFSDKVTQTLEKFAKEYIEGVQNLKGKILG